MGLQIKTFKNYDKEVTGILFLNPSVYPKASNTWFSQSNKLEVPSVSNTGCTNFLPRSRLPALRTTSVCYYQSPGRPCFYQENPRTDSTLLQNHTAIVINKEKHSHEKLWPDTNQERPSALSGKDDKPENQSSLTWALFSLQPRGGLERGQQGISRVNNGGRR